MSSPLANYRKRQKRQGFVRVEVQVRKEDAPLVRELAAALNDPARAPSTRRQLSVAARARTMDFKEFLASIPLDGIELERDRGRDRDVDL